MCPLFDLFCSANPSTGISVAVTTTDNCVHVINTASMREDWAVRSLCITSRQVSVPKRQTTTEAEASAKDTKNSSTSDNSGDNNNTCDEHQFLGVNCAAASRSQAHTLPFIQSDHYWRSTLAVEPRSQWLVCNGYPGQLQAFDRTSQSLSHTYQVIAAQLPFAELHALVKASLYPSPSYFWIWLNSGLSCARPC